jgi:predicted membrane-bound spermidine synthase
MIPWSHLDTAQVPGGGTLRLMQRGTEFSIRLDSNELMNSRLTATEQALATIACDKIRTRAKQKILIGGLRVRIREADVSEMIRAARSEYDAILLDVDNGPEGITREANDRLYDLDGLTSARRALRSGGVLAVWSSTSNPKFTARLKMTGFDVVENPLRAKGPQGGAKHFVWTATRTE